MRARSFLVGLAILASGVAPAAPLPPGPPPVRNRKELEAACRRFAQQMRFITSRIADQYVRPVKQEDLLEAGVVGLYQAARCPPPRNLRAQIRQAILMSGILQARALTEGVLTTSYGSSPDPLEDLLSRLRERLGDAPALDGQDAVVVACRALARLLDPHSGVVTADEQRRSVGTDYECVGVGLEFRERLTPGPLEIEEVHPGGPGQRAGLRPGDVITHVEGRLVEKATPEQALAMRQQGVADDMVQLARPVSREGDTPLDLPRTLRVKFRRPGGQTGTAVLLRERYRPESVLGVRRSEGNYWDFLLDEKERLAHIRITGLSRGTSEELREVLTELRQRRVRGVLLDLRWCPGGYLHEAEETAELFLGACVVATVKSRGREDTVYRSTDDGKFRDFPLVVLVNGETSGGAELIAAALQDHGRATIAGQRTLGKASVQTPLALGLDGVGFKLTSGTFLRPGGQNLHRFPESGTSDVWGVVPDEDCRLSPELGRKLKQWWHLHSLRPQTSWERLPLDDARADPQQQMALDVLRKRVGKKE